MLDPGRPPRAHDAERVGEQPAGVTRARLREQPLVRAVDLGELERERGPRRIALERKSPIGVVLGSDQLRFQPVDPADETAEQRPRAAPEVVPFERELVDPLEQHGESLAGAEHRLQGIHRRARPAQDQRRQLHRREDEQLLVGLDQRDLESRPHCVGARRRRHHDHDPLGTRPLRHQPPEPRLDHTRLTGARAAHDEEPPTAVGHGGPLGRGELVEHRVVRRSHGYQLLMPSLPISLRAHAV